MTICHHPPNVNSGLRSLHLLAKVGVCGGMCVQGHTYYDQACITHHFIFNPFDLSVDWEGWWIEHSVS